MAGLGIYRRKAVRQWLADCRSFYQNTAEASGVHNWYILHPMSLSYLGYLCIYLFIACPILNIPLQTNAVRIFTLLHAFFTFWVFLSRKKTPPVWVTDLAITLFAVQILGLSGFLGVAVFPHEASFLFPLCLVLMTQIYTRRPVFTILEVLIPAVVYLICCSYTRSTYAFFLDLISVSIAVCIAGAALYTNTSYKMNAYRAEQALQKMCALDLMTQVNNKPTFEFMVESYLHNCPGGSHALAICDFDHFKSINDHYGHHAGDEVLKAFAAKLHAVVDSDPNIIAGRFGGDEFVLFMKQCDDEQAFLKKLERLSVVEGFDFPVTISIGAAFSHAGSGDLWRYFDTADQSLYQAKSETAGGIRSRDADAPAAG